MPDLSTIKAEPAMALACAVACLLLIVFAIGVALSFGLDALPVIGRWWRRHFPRVVEATRPRISKLVESVPTNSKGGDFFIPDGTAEAMAADWSRIVAEEIADKLGKRAPVFALRLMREADRPQFKVPPIAGPSAYVRARAGVSYASMHEQGPRGERFYINGRWTAWQPKGQAIPKGGPPRLLPKLGNGPKASRHPQRRDSPMRTLCFLVAGCFSISGLFFGAVAAFSDHETVPLAASLALGFGSAIVAGLFIACGILAEMNDRGRA